MRAGAETGVSALCAGQRDTRDRAHCPAAVTTVLEEEDYQSALCSCSHQGNSFHACLLVSSGLLGQVDKTEPWKAITEFKEQHCRPPPRVCGGERTALCPTVSLHLWL